MAAVVALELVGTALRYSGGLFTTLYVQNYNERMLIYITLRRQIKFTNALQN